jgi:hypothetical protein
MLLNLILRLEVVQVAEVIMKGKCPKCGRRKHLTRHHHLPLRHYPGNGGPYSELCRYDHDKLELLIPFEPKLELKDYLNIYRSFILGQ